MIPTQLPRASEQHKERARNDQNDQGKVRWDLTWARLCVRENSHAQLIENCFQSMDTLTHTHSAEPEVLAVSLLHQAGEVAEEGLVSATCHPFVPSSLTKSDIGTEAGTLCQALH